MLLPLREEQQRPSLVDQTVEELEVDLPQYVKITHPHLWNVVNVSGVMFEHVCIACGDYARENFPEKCDLRVFTWDEERRRLFREDIEKRRPSQELLEWIIQIAGSFREPFPAASFIGTDQALRGRDVTAIIVDDVSENCEYTAEERAQIEEQVRNTEGIIINPESEENEAFGRQHLRALEHWFAERRETVLPNFQLSQREMEDIHQIHLESLSEHAEEDTWALGGNPVRSEGHAPPRSKKPQSVVRAEVDKMRGTDVYYYCVRAVHSENHHHLWMRSNIGKSHLMLMPDEVRKKHIDKFRAPKFSADPTRIPYCLTCEKLLTIPQLTEYYAFVEDYEHLDIAQDVVYSDLHSYIFINTKPPFYPDGWGKIMGREMLNNPPETAWHGNDFKGSDVALLKGRSFLDVLADTRRIPRREEALPRATALAHDPGLY